MKGMRKKYVRVFFYYKTNGFCLELLFFQIEGKGFFILSSAATRVLIRIINIVNNITYILYYEREIWTLKRKTSLVTWN